MAECKECGDEVEKLVSVKVDGKARKVCEDCADRIREEKEVAQESEGVVQRMMEFKGRRGPPRPGGRSESSSTAPTTAPRWRRSSGSRWARSPGAAPATCARPGASGWAASSRRTRRGACAKATMS